MTDMDDANGVEISGDALDKNLRGALVSELVACYTGTLVETQDIEAYLKSRFDRAVTRYDKARNELRTITHGLSRQQRRELRLACQKIRGKQRDQEFLIAACALASIQEIESDAHSFEVAQKLAHKIRGAL